MARDPHEAVDFAPAWLNFNNSNKKKPEKISGTTSSLSPLSFSAKLSGPTYRSSQSNYRQIGSPSRSNPHRTSPSSWTIGRHLPVDFAPTYIESRNDHYIQSPSRERNGVSRSATFSPTSSSLRSPSHQSYLSHNGETAVHRKSGSGDSGYGLDAEFPSLSESDSSEQYKNKTSQSRSTGTVVNMWQKPLVLKNSEPKRTENVSEVTKSTLSSSIYKTLVPKTSHQKQPYRRTMSVPLVFPSKSTNSIGELHASDKTRDNASIIRPNKATVGKMLTGNTSSLRLAKSELQNSLNTGLGNEGNHNDFCTKRLVEGVGEKVNNMADRSVEYKDYLHGKTNGNFNALQESGDELELGSTILSSSLEAEHRLLKEMGWKYSDEEATDEEPPLTEDEIREFQNKFNGIAPTVHVQREKALQNAFSGWKFSGIRNRSTDNDSTTAQDKNETLIEFSSDDNEI